MGVTPPPRLGKIPYFFFLFFLKPSLRVIFLQITLQSAEGDNCTIGLEYNLHPLRRSAKEKILHTGLNMTADMTVKV